jgi:hypothetical protein
MIISRKSFIISSIILTLLVVCSPVLYAQPKQASAREFIVEFYKWYTRIELKEQLEPAAYTALKLRSENFDSRIARLLKKYYINQQNCSDLGILDFDPFLNSQDPSPIYEVGNISMDNGVFTAEIYSEYKGGRYKTLAVKVNFLQRDGRWQITNFYYPEGDNLFHILSKPSPACVAPKSSQK